VSCSIAAPVVGFVVGANRIIRADRGPFQCIVQNTCKARCGADQAAERSLSARGRRVNQNTAAIADTI
jgi:hypothetical protein